MVQWINVVRNNGFVNPTQLSLLCVKNWSPIHSATRSYSREARRPLGRRICCKVRKFKFYIFDF